MRKKLFLLSVLSSMSVLGNVPVCDQTSILKEEDGLYLVCGRSREVNRNFSETSANMNAIHKITNYCKYSADCSGKRYTVEPLRLDCKKSGPFYSCERLMRIEFINEYEFSTKTSASVYGLLGLNNSAKSATPDFEFGAISKFRVNNLSLIGQIGYRLTQYTLEDQYTFLGEPWSEDVSFGGFVLGLGAAIETSNFEFSISRQFGELIKSNEEEYLYEKAQGGIDKVKIEETSLNILKKSNDVKYGIGFSSHSNTIPEYSNSLKLIFQKEI